MTVHLKEKSQDVLKHVSANERKGKLRRRALTRLDNSSLFVYLVMKKIVVLTGAGISEESGIKTFRDAGGLWEGHNIMEVASPEGWRKNKELVLEFYNLRRKQLQDVEPNDAHKGLVKLEEKYHVVIVTQNVDNLHERAGSKNIIHLHGELLKVRSTLDESLV